jgi:thioredoxin-like negative regulator of GroEL
LIGLNQPNRVDDALLIAETCRKLDPENGQVQDLIRRLREAKQAMLNFAATQAQIGAIEAKFRAEPNAANAFALANVYLQIQQTNRAVMALATALNQTNLDAGSLVSLANAFVQLNQVPLIEASLSRLVAVAPDNPEAWYDLSGVQAIMGRTTNAVQALGTALKLSGDRLARDPNARNLMIEVQKDQRFNGLRGMPEFQEFLKN